MGTKMKKNLPPGVNEKKITPEAVFRDKILNMAEKMGCRQDVQQHFDKYDRLLRNCSNDIERKHIAHLGIAELHRLLDCRGSLVVGGQLLIEGDDTPPKI